MKYILLLLLLLSTTIQAAGFVGVSAGESDLHEMSDTDLNGICGFADIPDSNCKIDDDYFYKVWVGYKPNRFIAFELDYNNLGEISIGDRRTRYTDVSITGYNTSINLYLPLSSKVELFARGGVYWWTIKTRINNANALPDEEGDDISLAAGININFDETFYMRLEVEEFEISSDYLTSIDPIQAYSIGFGKRF